MNTQKRFIYTVVAFITTFLLIGSLAQPAFGATQSGQVLKAERDINAEYYFYDEDKIIGLAGEYKQNVTFKKKGDENGKSVYEIDGDTWSAAGLEKDKVDKECVASIPAKRWNKDTEKKDPNKAALRIIVDQKGTAEIDVTGDRRGADNNDPKKGNDTGAFRWKTTTESYKNRAEDIPADSDGATVSYDDRRAYEVKGASRVEEGGVLYFGDEGSLSCTYEFYNYFWRFITKFDALNRNPTSVSGKILGQPGMKFTDWAKKADHRLQYLAYYDSGRSLIINHCATKVDMFVCINKVDDVRRDCQAKAIGQEGNPVTNEVLNNIESPHWDKPLDETEFVKCFSEKNELVDAEYFADKDALESFAQRIVDSAVFPPSLNIQAPAEVKDEPAPDDTQCSIGMLGWILCPVFSFMGSINDKVYNILKNWLVLAPFQTSSGGSNSAAYDVWTKFRDIANVMFIIAFLAIIYAQVTGRAASDYGLRRRMPRIIIVALLVNLSYIICGVVVDIVNVAGDSIFKLLVNTTIEGSGIEQYGTWEKVVTTITLGGGAAAGTLAILGNLAALVPMLLAAFIALVATFLVLLFRQAAIIILVIVAPIAFAMLVLPSTEKWFNKWKDFFLQLLFIYPIFALVFGGSNMAAEVIRGDAAENGEVLLTIFSLAIMVIPLFTIPLILKLGGGVANRFTGILDRQTNKGFIGGLKKGAQEFRDDRKVQQQTRALSGRGGALFAYGSLIRGNQRRKAKGVYAKSMASKNASEYVGTSRLGTAAGAAAGTFAPASLKQAAKDALRKEVDKAERENHEAEVVRIENGDHQTAEQLMNAALPKGNGEHRSDRSAAIQKVVESGDVGNINKLVDNVQHLTEFERKMLADTIDKTGLSSKAAHLDKVATEAIRNGQVTNGSAGLYRAAVANGNYSAEVMAAQDPNAIAGLAKSGLSTTEKRELAGHFQAAKANGKLNSRMSYATRSSGDHHFGGRS